MVQLPAERKVNAPLLAMVQTSVVLELKVGVSPESLVAVKIGVVPKFCAPGLAKVMAWVPLGVTLLDAADALPVPEQLVAVTVKKYAVPLVRPVTSLGLDAPVAVMPPGLDV